MRQFAQLPVSIVDLDDIPVDRQVQSESFGSAMYIYVDIYVNTCVVDRWTRRRNLSDTRTRTRAYT